jgi:predicted Zn finger-like uncharacterized protein
MSLATRCPSCGTAFRVVQDQLKVSEGWVRCGNCQDVFNALESLFDLEPEARHKASVPMPLEQPAQNKPAVEVATPPAAPPAPPAPLPPTQQAAAAPAADLPTDPPASQLTAPDPAAAEGFWAPVAPPDAQAEPTPLPAAPVDTPAADLRAGPAFEVQPPDPTQASGVAAAPTRAATADAAAPASLGEATPAWTGIRRRRGPARAAARPAAPRQLTSGETTQPSLLAAESRLPAADAPERVEPAPAAPAFVRQAERAARWQSPVWRAGLGASAALLLMALLLQISVFDRDLLASRWPALQPALSLLCQPLACAVAAPRDIEHLVLDNSRLARTPQADVLQLVAELRNRSATAVRKPALDVSFTDSSGQQVVRKVFLAEQLDGAGDRIEANAAWAVDIRLRTPAVAITGFTIEVFYP